MPFVKKNKICQNQFHRLWLVAGNGIVRRRHFSTYTLFNHQLQPQTIKREELLLKQFSVSIVQVDLSTEINQSNAL